VICLGIWRLRGQYRCAEKVGLSEVGSVRVQCGVMVLVRRCSERGAEKRSEEIGNCRRRLQGRCNLEVAM
jgi:hypothetical protein